MRMQCLYEGEFWGGEGIWVIWMAWGAGICPRALLRLMHPTSDVLGWIVVLFRNWSET